MALKILHMLSLLRRHCTFQISEEISESVTEQVSVSNLFLNDFRVDGMCKLVLGGAVCQRPLQILKLKIDFHQLLQ